MTPPQAADLLIHGAILVTMDPQQPLLHDGALAVRGDRIVGVGPSVEMLARFEARERIDGSRFCITPGLVNTHCHITGEPLTKGFMPDGVSHVSGIRDYAIPLYSAHDPHEERLSAQFAALEMLRTGTTSFIEAGSTKHLPELVDGLEEIGIRARVGQWTWDRSNSPNRPSIATDAAIDRLATQLERYPSDGRRVAAWPNLVGHSAVTDGLWQAARELARNHGTGMTFHMSPVQDDPAYFLEHTGRRPVAHLHDIGLLGPEVVIAHAIHLDMDEVDLLAASGTHVAHCPMVAFKLGYGITRHGLMPEMVEAGVNLCLGTDGSNNSNTSDLMRAGFVAAGAFKDARGRVDLFPAQTILEMLTINGAYAMQMGDDLGRLQAGRKADFVMHDTWRPEWRPLLDVVAQLVWSADGRSVHSVWVDGVRVVDNHRLTLVDEDKLYADAQKAGEAIVSRTRTPRQEGWLASARAI